MRLVLGMILALVGLVAAVFFFFMSRLSTDATFYQVDLISSRQRTLYIKRWNWSVTGDSQVTVISTDDDQQMPKDSTHQLRIEGLEPFLYHVSGDTLFLAVRELKTIPAELRSGWIIVQEKVDSKRWYQYRNGMKYKSI